MRNKVELLSSNQFELCISTSDSNRNMTQFCIPLNGNLFWFLKYAHNSYIFSYCDQYSSEFFPLKILWLFLKALNHFLNWPLFLKWIDKMKIIIRRKLICRMIFGISVFFIEYLGRTVTMWWNSPNGRFYQCTR